MHGKRFTVEQCNLSLDFQLCTTSVIKHTILHMYFSNSYRLHLPHLQYHLCTFIQPNLKLVGCSYKYIATKLPQCNANLEFYVSIVFVLSKTKYPIQLLWDYIPQIPGYRGLQLESQFPPLSQILRCIPLHDSYMYSWI